MIFQRMGYDKGSNEVKVMSRRRGDVSGAWASEMIILSI